MCQKHYMVKIKHCQMEKCDNSFVIEKLIIITPYF